MIKATSKSLTVNPLPLFASSVWIPYPGFSSTLLTLSSMLCEIDESCVKSLDLALIVDTLLVRWLKIGHVGSLRSRDTHRAPFLNEASAVAVWMCQSHLQYWTDGKFGPQISDRGSSGDDSWRRLGDEEWWLVMVNCSWMLMGAND